MRKGFSMVTAILFMVLVSTLGVTMLKLSVESVKTTGDIYLKEQAAFLLRSATEIAIAKIILNPNKIANSSNCFKNQTIFNEKYSLGGLDIFNLKVVASKVFGKIGDCNNFTPISTSESAGTVVLDTYIEIIPAAMKIKNSGKIRLHRRTIQKL